MQVGHPTPRGPPNIKKVVAPFHCISLHTRQLICLLWENCTNVISHFLCHQHVKKQSQLCESISVTSANTVSTESHLTTFPEIETTFPSVFRTSPVSASSWYCLVLRMRHSLWAISSFILNSSSLQACSLTSRIYSRDNTRVATFLSN